MILSKEYILDNLRARMPEIQQRFHVQNMALFGSYARDEATEESDLDFLVEFDVPLEQYIQNHQALREFLQNEFNRSVDLANPKSLKEFYRQKILSQAINV
jgi:predicted nucleotidyltransferase